jgi:Zn-finger nucleic acid-binding protein
MAAIMSDAKSGYWSLACSQCESIIKMTGASIVAEDLQSVSCPNCRGSYLLGNLKTVVNHLEAFQKALKKATDQKSEYLAFIKIIPPGFEG